MGQESVQKKVIQIICMYGRGLTPKLLKRILLKFADNVKIRPTGDSVKFSNDHIKRVFYYYFGYQSIDN